jgi:hypothetical protein
VDVIVTAGTPATLAVKKATTSIPLVMVAVADPVGDGIVASLARPGGNITGVTSAHWTWRENGSSCCATCCPMLLTQDLDELIGISPKRQEGGTRPEECPCPECARALRRTRHGKLVFRRANRSYVYTGRRKLPCKGEIARDIVNPVNLKPGLH